MSGGAFALITPLRVQADSSTTQQGVPLTLINVHAVFHHHESTFVSLKAFALKTARRVDTCSMTAQIRGDAALVNVCAVPLLSSEGEAAVASTLETANGVSASSISTQTLEDLTLIHIFIERPAGQDVSSVCKAMSSGTDGPVLR